MTYAVEKDEAVANGEAEFEAMDWCYKVVLKREGEEEDYIICLCADATEAEHIAKVLNEKPYDFSTGERIVT